MKEVDPDLVAIANWRNDETENEYIWISYIFAWYDRMYLQRMHKFDLEDLNFSFVCSTGDIFELLTAGDPNQQEEPSEAEERENQEKPEEPLREIIDEWTGKPVVQPPDPVGHFMDANGVFRNAPPLSGKSKKRISEILPIVLPLWRENSVPEWRKARRGLDGFLNHPRLKRCPECKKWFVVSKTDQEFCQYRPFDRRTGKRRPLCRIVAYQRTQEYKEKNKQKVTKWRANKERKQVAEVTPAATVQKIVAF